jgi:hypothetical protein
MPLSERDYKTHNWIKVILCVILAVGTIELVGINALVRRFVQRGFQQMEIVLAITLSLLMILFISRKSVGPPQILHAILFGLGSGLVSGVVAMASLSANYHRVGLFHRASSFSEIAGFIGAATVETFGWLVGILSGVYLSIAVGGKTSPHACRTIE